MSRWRPLRVWRSRVEPDMWAWRCRKTNAIETHIFGYEHSQPAALAAALAHCEARSEVTC